MALGIALEHICKVVWGKELVQLKHFWKHQHLCRYPTFFPWTQTSMFGLWTWARLHCVQLMYLKYCIGPCTFYIYEVTKPTGSYPSLSMQYKKLLLSEAFVTILFLQPSLCPEGEHTVKMAPRCFYLFFIRRLYLLPHSISIFLAFFF